MTDLAQAIELYRRALPAGRLMEFSLTPLDRLGIPVTALSFFPDTAQGYPETCWQLCEGIGYGRTEEEALVGAYGELTEEVSSTMALGRMTRVTASYREMLERHRSSGVIDPVALCLDAGSTYTPDTVLDWVETQRLSTREKVFVPVEFVACSGMDAPAREGVSRLVTPITNGHGAGASIEMAQLHGLFELLQRDGNSVQYRALARGAAVDLPTITDPVARELLDLYDRAGVEIVVKIASTDFGMANLYVVGYDREPVAGALPVTAAACGEAVHPSAAVALRKALLEFASSRARLALFHGPLETVAEIAPSDYLDAYRKVLNPAEEEPRGLRGMQRWVGYSLEQMRAVLAPVFLVRERIRWDQLKIDGAPAAVVEDKAALLQAVSERLIAGGFDVLSADLSTPGQGVFATKMIVPGLEVETMSYHRIGERNVRRLLARAAADPDFPVLAGVGKPPGGAVSIPLTEEARQRLGGGAWLDTARLDSAMQDLYVLYREPSRHVTAFSLAAA